MKRFFRDPLIQSVAWCFDPKVIDAPDLTNFQPLSDDAQAALERLAKFYKNLRPFEKRLWPDSIGNTLANFEKIDNRTAVIPGPTHEKIRL